MTFDPLPDLDNANVGMTENTARLYLWEVSERGSFPFLLSFYHSAAGRQNAPVFHKGGIHHGQN